MLLTSFRAPCKCLRLLLLLAVLVALGLWGSINLLQLEPRNIVYRLLGPCTESVNFRSYLAGELRNIKRDLQNSELNEVSRFHLRIKLTGLVSMLDSTFAVGERLKRLEAENATSLENGLPFEVCPEKYTGTLTDYPYHEKAFVTQTCHGAKQLHQLLSVVVNTVGWSQDQLERVPIVLKGMRKYNRKMQIYLAASDEYLREFIRQYETDVKVIGGPSSSRAKSGKVWNALLRLVQTRYVLVTRDLVHFDSYSQLERLIRVVSTFSRSVGVAGGAYRNETGHWKMGCYQTQLRNSVITYVEGYEHSLHECMLCDYMDGPFVAQTALFTRYRMDERLPSDAVLPDWFLALKQQKLGVVLGCPDAMFYTRSTSAISSLSRETVQLLATKIQVERFFISPSTLHKFSCDEIGVKCNNVKQDLMLPLCCRRRTEQVLSTWHNFTTQQGGIAYELVGGLLQGAVQFADVPPWKVDYTIAFDISETSKIRASIDSYPDRISYVGHDMFYIESVDHIKVTLIGRNISATRTLAKIGSTFFHVPLNPVVALNKNIAVPRKQWATCSKSGFHGCLKNYELEGNLAIRQPHFLHVL